MFFLIVSCPVLRSVASLSMHAPIGGLAFCCSDLPLRLVDFSFGGADGNSPADDHGGAVVGPGAIDSGAKGLISGKRTDRRAGNRSIKQQSQIRAAESGTVTIM